MSAPAWVIRRFGEPADVLELSSVDVPPVGETDVLVDVDAIGLNFLDVSVCRGAYSSRPPLPLVPGAELAGRIASVGSGVDGLAVGNRVAAMNPRAQGGFAAAVVVPAAGVRRVPDAMPVEHAASILVTYQTAYVALVRRAALQAGEWVLVHAAAGGTGTAAIQLARAHGARVIATAGTDEKVQVCLDEGAEVAVDYRRESFVPAVLDATGGKGADVVFDPVGGDVFRRSLECVAFEGRLLPIGWSSGDPPVLEVGDVLGRNVTVVGVAWGLAYPERRPDVVRDAHAAIVALHAEGKVRPRVGRTWDFDELPAAVQALADGEVIGKAVVRAPTAAA